jgi:glycine C-acetyltransferase
LPRLGVIANLVEFPAVPKGQARFRLQVMAEHVEANILAAVNGIAAAHRQALEAREPDDQAPALRAIA